LINKETQFILVAYYHVRVGGMELEISIALSRRNLGLLDMEPKLETCKLHTATPIHHHQPSAHDEELSNPEVLA
jgi:hypothetical protein